jgi:hypothetical protein
MNNINKMLLISRLHICRKSYGGCGVKSHVYDFLRHVYDFQNHVYDDMQA